jgi:hypothetical protein
MELDDPFITRIARPKGAVRNKTAKLPSSKFKTVDSVSAQVTGILVISHRMLQ